MLQTLKKILLIYLTLLSGWNVFAENAVEIEIKIEHHVFYPSEIDAPAGRKIKLIIHNMDDTIEEFESFDLKREKIVPSNGKINIILAPLSPGKYEFFGDFHEPKPRGTINVK